MIKAIDAAQFCSMVVCGANYLNENRAAVDALNVFPVPDGDTGTNMALTFLAAAQEVENGDYASLSDAASAVAKATLRGARGNSGVILSQIFRGISLELKGHKEADSALFAAALQRGSDTAYRAVMKPTEGTILTVARKSAKAAADYEGRDIVSLLNIVIAQGRKTLEKTPDMLPQLKLAGVVDAGGQGFLYILEGFLSALAHGGVVAPAPARQAAPPAAAPQAALATEDIVFTYCTEFMIHKSDPAVSAGKFKSAISAKGDSTLVIDEDDLVKVHIHTNNPGFVLEKALTLGELGNIKIENMKRQHTTILQNGAAAETGEVSPAPVKNSAEPEKAYGKEFGFVAVCAGGGIAEMFRQLGADQVINGGQTMNPSTEDILYAVENTDAKTVFVLPNNKNIILAAQQAKYLTDRAIEVLPTRSVPQGLCAMLAFDYDASADKNFERLSDFVKKVADGSVTHAVRDTHTKNNAIKSGDYIAVSNDEIVAVAQELDGALFDLLKALDAENSDIVTVLCGEDISDEKISLLEEKLEELYPDSDIAVKKGGQPVYYYIAYVE